MKISQFNPKNNFKNSLSPIINFIKCCHFDYIYLTLCYEAEPNQFRNLGHLLQYIFPQEFFFTLPLPYRPEIFLLK